MRCNLIWYWRPTTQKGKVVSSHFWDSSSDLFFQL